MSSETEIFFPDTLPFPLTVRALLAHPTRPVRVGQRILNYSFVYQPVGAPPETRFGSWDATFDGELKDWNVKVGDRITRDRVKSRHALRIIEPCKHGMQFNGLCALCGIDVTNLDYTGRAESSRAIIQMTHSASGPTVSLEEAQRLEKETAQHLLKARKLSLIVDLDQTIVHATVDPTVGDWISEGENWEERQRRRIEKKATKTNTPEDDDSGSSDSSDESEDEVNPNWEALKDVKKFRLPPDNFSAPRSRWKEAQRGIQNDGCQYYVKPRPGWQDFLSSIAEKYEMHVYTMGTRAYAEEVCAAIDPDGRIFGGRILSRDESGSLTQKSLRRLFPCDTSMVVIIDDRADVWEWSPNLIKVIPYDFFVGIGDINSTFLPKVDALGGSSISQAPPPSASSGSGSESATPKSTPSSAPSNSEDGSNEVDAEGSNGRPSAVKKEMITQNTIALDAQMKERPLAKKQEQLESDDEGLGDENNEVSTEPKNDESQNGNGTQPSPSEHVKAKHHRKALLKNDDDELQRVGKLLNEVHTRFYNAYDNRLPESNRRRKSLSHREVPYDVKYIIPSIRKETFKDVHILFSGVIPTNMRIEHESTEIWRMARAFGATCHKELTKEVTHVVTSKRGTQKVEKAKTMEGVIVVWFQWFTDSVAQWRRLDEDHYALDDDNTKQESNSPLLEASSPPSDPNAISTDTDPEGLVGEGDADGDLDDDLEDSLSSDPSLRQINIGAGTGIGLGISIPETDPDPEIVEDVGSENGADGVLNLDEVNWQDVNDEVEAAMMESDSEDGEEGGGDDTRSVGSASARSTNASEDESMAEDDLGSLPPTPHRARKRQRSVTPSESSHGGRDIEKELLRSPLAKRKKIAADRSGTSKLKLTLSVGDLEATDEVDEDNDSYPNTPIRGRGNGSRRSSKVGSRQGSRAGSRNGSAVSAGSQGSYEDDDENELLSEEGEEIDDDFLAREMEAELG